MFYRSFFNLPAVAVSPLADDLLFCPGQGFLAMGQRVGINVAQLCAIGASELALDLVETLNQERLFLMQAIEQGFRVIH